MAYAERRDSEDDPEIEEVAERWAMNGKTGLVGANPYFAPGTGEDIDHIHEADEGDKSFLDWPNFGIRYTFNPSGVGIRGTFKPDEVVCFDAIAGPERCWISAERGSFVSLEETR